MKKLLIVLGLLITAGAFLEAATVSLTTGSVGKDVEVMRQFLDDWEKKSGHTAKIVSMPASTTDQFGQYKIWLGAQNSDIDIYQMDVIWAPQLDSHFVDLSKSMRKEAKEHFSAIIDSQTVKGKLVAIPFFTDAPMLYYRKDLLTKYGEKPPKTWKELYRIAKKIQDAERAAGNSKIHGFVFQGNAYEGLTCDALEWVNSYGGGTIVDGRGKVTIKNKSAIQAIDYIATFVGVISPEGVLSYQEEESRGVWQTGNAVFMRNWPYAYSLGNSDDSSVKGKFDVVTLPKGEGRKAKSAATLGGWNLGVAKYSKNQDVAIDLVRYLTSRETQKRNAIEASKLPTRADLYEDADVLKVAPFFANMKNVLANSVGRPAYGTKTKYNEVSKEFWTAVHSVLSGDQDAKKALGDLEKRLKRVKGRSW